MISRIRILFLVLAAAILFSAGCSTDTLMLKPGVVPPSAGEEAAEGARWSFWVEKVADLREGVDNPARVGSIDQRFSDKPTVVFLEPPPADYFRDELSSFLLARSLEASSSRKARIFLTVEIYRFEISRDSEDILDEITARVDCKVFFRDKEGNDLGAVKIPAERRVTTTVGSKAKMQALVRDTLALTFETLASSDTFAAAQRGR